MGTDIADLLLDGHEPTTVDYSMMGLKINPSSDTLDEEFDETVDMSVVTSDRSVIARGRKTQEETTDRFRHLLLYGRKKVKSLVKRSFEIVQDVDTPNALMYFVLNCFKLFNRMLWSGP